MRSTSVLHIVPASSAVSRNGSQAAKISTRPTQKSSMAPLRRPTSQLQNHSQVVAYSPPFCDPPPFEMVHECRV
jgi:hypothetical protein